ncbi:DUF5694 domain-containing protein [Erythrobacter sp. GH1-10]|uniref:DUF5694 domain-containing protein n=1 Tax=Erythrobacter sp. GH1-10 TaxID=3349334 RepID=UPI00387798B0
MDGERLQSLAHDPMRNSWSLSPETHSRPTGTRYIPLGVEMQTRLAVLPADARDEARDLASRWDEIELSERFRLIALQTAGYEIYSAVLNWSYLDEDQRALAKQGTLAPLAETLDELLDNPQEVYALGVPIARRAGLHRLCMADAIENETAGMKAALALGGQEILDDPAVLAALEAYNERVKSEWQPGSGPGALTKMLAFMNSDEFAEFDRENQWEFLRSIDNEAGAFHRRLMHWNARTAQISAELFEALAEGPNERVMLIIGAAHRPFNEAELRSQPWIRVEPALDLLRPALRE